MAHECLFEIGSWAQEPRKARSGGRVGIVVGSYKAHVELLVVNVMLLSSSPPKLRTYEQCWFNASQLQPYRMAAPRLAKLNEQFMKASSQVDAIVEMDESNSNCVAAAAGDQGEDTVNECQGTESRSSAAGDDGMEEGTLPSFAELNAQLMEESSQIDALVEMDESSSNCVVGAAGDQCEQRVDECQGADSRSSAAGDDGMKEGTLSDHVCYETPTRMSDATLGKVEVSPTVATPAAPTLVAQPHPKRRARALPPGITIIENPLRHACHKTPPKKRQRRHDLFSPVGSGQHVRCNVEVQWFHGAKAYRMAAMGQGRISKRGLLVEGGGDILRTQGLVRDVIVSDEVLIRLHAKFVHEGKTTFVVRDVEEDSGGIVKASLLYVFVSKADPGVLKQVISSFKRRSEDPPL